VVARTGYSDIGFYCSYFLQQATTNSLPVGLSSSTTDDKAFQHCKAQLLISKSVFKLKMVGYNLWNFWWVFSIFCEKLQNVCPLTANPDQMDKNGCDFWTQRPPNPLQTSSPQKACLPV